VSAAAIIYVKDVDRMRAFYEGCLGLVVTEQGQRYCVLESSDWTLSLVEIGESVAATVEVATPPRRRESTPIKLAFVVLDVEALRPRMALLGGELNPASTTWEFGGFVRTDCLDPEGNVLQLLVPTVG
jgi:predicted enzyme related to lactoylglutathione lyase